MRLDNYMYSSTIYDIYSQVCCAFSSDRFFQRRPFYVAWDALLSNASMIYTAFSVISFGVMSFETVMLKALSSSCPAISDKSEYFACNLPAKFLDYPENTIISFCWNSSTMIYSQVCYAFSSDIFFQRPPFSVAWDPLLSNASMI